MDRLVVTAVEAPIQDLLTYRLPKSLSSLGRGDSVVVPLGRRKANAIILGDGTIPKDIEVKEIQESMTERPSLPDSTMQWLQWLADYYQYPMGPIATLCFPPLDKKVPKELKGKSKAKPKREVVVAGVDKNITLNPAQKSAVDEICKSNDFQTSLLFGVTGSGKTEVYMDVFSHHMARGEPCLLLVPEISLTPQLVQRFAAKFPDQVAVYHSQLTEREKTNQWWDVVDGKKKILIGARSALFCPVQKWGVVIVDEEHEPSYKQEEKLKYNARDAAIMLGKIQNCPVVLGSATPSLETWHNAQTGRYKLIELKDRVQDRQMPEMILVDMKDQRDDPKAKDLPFWLSPVLFENMKETLAADSQVALFLNRRGMAHQVFCESCGHIEECENCDISLTVHAKKHLVCHYCGYEKILKDLCEQCHSGELKLLGLGTEKMEDDLRELFPEVKIARADRDEIRSREDLETLIDQMEKNEIQILIGTQMIAKGLDFPNLNLVGVVLADVGLNIPDFRATERAFQLITQMSGRGGRHSKVASKTVIQTYNPEHFGLQLAMKNQYVEFANQELIHRQQLNYPPFGKLMVLRFQGKNGNQVSLTAERFLRLGEELQSKNPIYDEVRILGPTPAPLSKLKGLYRWHVMLKGPNAAILRKFVMHLNTSKNVSDKTTRILLDVDPVSLL